jgi:hypothetical protein
MNRDRRSHFSRPTMGSVPSVSGFSIGVLATPYDPSLDIYAARISAGGATISTSPVATS